MVLLGYSLLFYYIIGILIISSEINQYGDTEFSTDTSLGKIKIKDIPIIVRLIIIIIGGFIWLPLFIYILITSIKSGEIKKLLSEHNDEEDNK